MVTKKAVVKQAQVHAQYKSIPMELMKVGMEYAITISPPDIRAISKNEVALKRDLQTTILKHMFVLQRGLKYVHMLRIYPELSASGRLHYHGYISVSNVLNFYYNDTQILSNLGMYEIDTLSEDEEGKARYLAYCTKQQEYWKEMFEYMVVEEYPIIVKGNGRAEVKPPE